MAASTPAPPPGRRMSAPERRRQLLDVALSIVRDEGADRLTLGHLAARAGVSKPVAYDHFGTRSGLLIELYRWIDTERVNGFRKALQNSEHSVDETVAALASGYIDCAADTQGEFFAVGAALAGSEEKVVVFQELLDHCVAMFVEVLAPYSRLSGGELVRCCIGLVGAGEALSSSLVRGQVDSQSAAATLATLIKGSLGCGPDQRTEPERRS